MASGLTATYLFPYPLQTDAVDVAADMQALAQAIETTSLLKAPLLSPALTGSPTAPTPNNSDNSTLIATTAFVKNQSYLTTTTAASTYAPLASPTFTGIVTAPSLVATTFILNRTDTVYEGGEIIFRRATDNSAAWTLDVYGNTSTPVFRVINSTGSGVVNTLSIDTAAVATFGGTVVLPAATTSIPSLRIPHGTAPSSPTNGDVWTTTVGMYARINGNTVGPFGTGATYTGSAPTAITGALWANSTYNSLRVYTGTRWASMDGVEVPSAKTASYTLALGDDGTLIQMAGATTNAITVPTNATVAFPIGSSIMVIQTSTVQTVISGAGVSFLATPGLKLRTQYSSATLIKVGTDTWAVMGDLAA